MHLSHDDGCIFPGHVAGSDAVFYSVGGVRVLVHHADSPSRQRDDEGPIAEAVELAAKGEAAVRYKPDGVNGLSKESGTCRKRTASLKCWARP